MPTNAGRSITVTINGTLAIPVRPTRPSPTRPKRDSPASTAVPARFRPTTRTPPNEPGPTGQAAGLNNYATNGWRKLDIYDPTPTKSLPTSSESSTSRQRGGDRRNRALSPDVPARGRHRTSISARRSTAGRPADAQRRNRPGRVRLQWRRHHFLHALRSRTGRHRQRVDARHDHSHFRPPRRGHHRWTIRQRNRPDIQPGHAHQLGQRRRPGVRRPGVQCAGREHLGEPKPA